jgi:DNA-directed RNA polymerase alpha subunit
VRIAVPVAGDAPVLVVAFVWLWPCRLRLDHTKRLARREDSIYSPVRRVSYNVAPTRVGQVTDYDKLLLTVETNGAVTPEDSVALAARILQDQFQLFINFDEPQQIRAEEPQEDLPFNRNPLHIVRVRLV